MNRPEEKEDTPTLDFATVITSVDNPPRLLTKTLTADGKAGVAPGHPYYITSVRCPVMGLADLVAVFDRVDRHSCVINGEALYHIEDSDSDVPFHVGEVVPDIDPTQPHRRIKLPKTDKQTGEVTPPCYGPASHHWLLIDVDGPESDGFGWLWSTLGFGGLPLEVTALLPPELNGVDCHWRLTSSAGVKPGVHIRLAYWLDRVLSDEEKLEWLSAYPHCDGSVCDPVQENYVCAPVLADGVVDPLAEYQLERTGMIKGFRRVVEVPEITLPTRSPTSEIPDGLTADGQDPGLQQAAKALLIRVADANPGVQPRGRFTRSVIRLLGDMRTREGKIFGDADIVALLVDHWPAVAGLDDIDDMVERLGEGRQQPRGCTCIDIEYSYTETKSAPVSYVFGQHFFPGATIDMKPTIHLNGDYLGSGTRAAVKAMRDQRLGFFRRGGRLVRPMPSQVTIRDGKTIVADRLKAVSWQELREQLGCVANFETYTDKNGWRPTNCPMDLAQTIYAISDRIDLPILDGIITAPTMLLDGTILDKPGYDEATGLLYQPSITFPAVPEKPTKAQAVAALAKLKHLVRTFPFETDADRSVWLSAVLTGVIRRTLPTAPMHLFNAPVAGSGKGLLADMAAIIATGRQASAITQSTDVETEKRLVSMLLAGDPVIMIDNATTAILGDFLCSMLTQPTVNARKLGVSEAPPLTTNVLMLATGNNIRCYGDMTRRSIRCTIDPKMEKPADREFDSCPLADARRDRGELLTAALTVLRAHIVAGCPESGVMGSFEDWARVVVGSLLWLGEADPITTQAALSVEDPDTAKLRALLSSWYAVFGDTPMTIKAALTHHGRSGVDAFHEAVASVVHHSDMAMAGQKLGNYIGAKKHRVVGGLRFHPGKLLHGAATWFVEQMPA